MNFKTVKKLISCALPAWLLLGSGQNLLGSARFLLGSGRFWWVHVISSTAVLLGSLLLHDHSSIATISDFSFKKHSGRR